MSNYLFRGAVSGHLGKKTQGNLSKPFSSLSHVHYVCRFWEGSDFLDAGFLVLCTKKARKILEEFSEIEFLDVEIEKTHEYDELSTTKKELELFCIQLLQPSIEFKIEKFQLIISENVKNKIDELNLSKCKLEKID